MPLYRKRPVIVAAYQMTRDARIAIPGWPDWLVEAWNREPETPGAVWPSTYPHSDGLDELCIGTLEGVHRVSFGDWIIRGVKGELYPCKPDIFRATYELVAGIVDEVMPGVFSDPRDREEVPDVP